MGNKSPVQGYSDHPVEVERGQAVQFRLADGRVVWLTALAPRPTNDDCCLVITSRERVPVRHGSDPGPMPQEAP